MSTTTTRDESLYEAGRYFDQHWVCVQESPNSRGFLLQVDDYYPQWFYDEQIQNRVGVTERVPQHIIELNKPGLRPVIMAEASAMTYYHKQRELEQQRIADQAAQLERMHKELDEWDPRINPL